VLAPSLSKRRDRWFVRLHDLLVELEQRVENFDPAELAENEAFVTALIDASRIAMGTHLEEKLDLLKQCLLRMALDQERDTFLDLRFFRYIDDLDPEHFLILKYLATPGAWFDGKCIDRPQLAMGSRRSLMGQAQLPLSGVPLDVALRDLSDRALADTGSLGTVMSGGAIWEGCATELGSQLLDFVEVI